MNKCITNNYLKLKHISILQIINHNMLKKINHNKLICLYTQGLKGILIKYHLTKHVRQVKQILQVGH